jgi:hypothetical protein
MKFLELHASVFFLNFFFFFQFVSVTLPPCVTSRRQADQRERR